MSPRVPYDLAAFADPWEHIRLLSDTPRNKALLTLLERRAPDHRVLEVGCGTGLLSLIAARLGATRVHAVEPTEQALLARELVRRNGLQSTVTVHQATIEDLDPRPVDLAFSELLNADPFLEGVLSAMHAAAAWTRHGHLAPHRLRVYAALTDAAAPADEADAANDAVRALAARFDLDLSPLLSSLRPLTTSSHLLTDPTLLSAPTLVWDLEPGVDLDPEDAEDVVLIAEHAGRAGGVVVWFEADLDAGIVHTNAPGLANHWGQWVGGFSVGRDVAAGDEVAVEIEVDGGVLEVRG